MLIKCLKVVFRIQVKHRWLNMLRKLCKEEWIKLEGKVVFNIFNFVIILCIYEFEKMMEQGFKKKKGEYQGERELKEEKINKWADRYIELI